MPTSQKVKVIYDKNGPDRSSPTIRRMIWAKKDPEKWLFLKAFYTNQITTIYELIRNARFFHLKH